MRYKMTAGLGNPGKEYSNTYHNIGLMALDLIAPDSKYKKHGLFEYAKFEGSILLKPLTFMNESGPAVAEAMRFFKLKPDNLLLIHDDSDIRLGRYKLSCDSRSAGHNGVKSVISSLGTQKFCRLRIGIRPPESAEKAHDIVLEKVSKMELDKLKEIVKRAALETLGL